MDVFFFVLFAIITIACGVNLVLQRHPINSALSLIGVMGSLAILYLLLGAEFIAAAQIVVYAGAIMVLFIFTIMLLNAGAEERSDRSRMARFLGVPLLTAFLLIVVYLIQSQLPREQGVSFGAFTGGGAREIGRSLFTRYLLPFEITSVLILIAILGAIVLARKEID